MTTPIDLSLFYFVLYVTIENSNSALVLYKIIPTTHRQYFLPITQQIPNDEEFNSLADISYDPISSVPCPRKCSCFVDNTAHCGRETITTIPCDISTKRGGNTMYQSWFSPNLTSLYLSNNKIKEIIKNCFVTGGRNIKTLSFRQNRISSIDPKFFADLTRLEVLDLTGNLVASLVLNGSSPSYSTPLFFFLSRRLKSLLLSDNSIKFIPQKSFQGLNSLEVLALSRNEIRWIAGRAFEDLTSLRVLRLRGNPLILKAMSRFSLSLLWFSSNFKKFLKEQGDYVIKLSTVPNYSNGSSETQTTKKLQKSGLKMIFSAFFFEYKKLFNSSKRIETVSSMDLGELNLRKVPLGLAKSLKILYLDRNEISVLRTEDFSELSNLQYLYLSHNNISEISGGVFAGLEDLYSLDLSSNSLCHLSTNSFDGLKNVVYLRLNKNLNLTWIPQEIFKPMERLQFLYLQNCALQTLPAGPWLFKLIALWLYGNPLRCDCSNLAPVLLRLKYDRSHGRKFYLDIYRKKFVDIGSWEDQRPEKSQCSHPFQFAGTPLKNIKPKDLHCSGKELIEILINRNAVYPSMMLYASDDSYSESTQQRDEINRVIETKTIIFSRDAENSAVAPQDAVESDQLPEEKFEKSLDSVYNLVEFKNLMSDEIEASTNVERPIETYEIWKNYDQYEEVNLNTHSSAESSGQTETLSASLHYDVYNASSNVFSSYNHTAMSLSETADSLEDEITTVNSNSNNVTLEEIELEFLIVNSTMDYEEVVGASVTANHTYTEFDDEYDNEYWEEYQENYWNEDSQIESDFPDDVTGVSTNDYENGNTEYDIYDQINKWINHTEVMTFWNLLDSIILEQEEERYFYDGVSQRQNDDYEGNYVITHYNLSDFDITFDDFIEY